MVRLFHNPKEFLFKWLKELCHSKQTKWRPRHFLYHEMNSSLPAKHQPGQVFPMAKKVLAFTSWIPQHSLPWIHQRRVFHVLKRSFWSPDLALFSVRQVNQWTEQLPPKWCLHTKPCLKSRRNQTPTLPSIKMQAPNEHTDKIFLLELLLLFKEGEVGTLGKGAVSDVSSPWFPLLIYFMLH